MLTYQNRTYSLEELKSLTFSTEDSLLLFCKQWLNQTPFFEVNTSGSTGEPKTITLSRQQIENSVLQTQKALELTSTDTCLINLSGNHIAAKMMMARALVIGMQATIISPSNNPLKSLTSSFDFHAFVPLQLNAILTENNTAEIALLNKAKAIIIGGAPMSLNLIHKVKERITAPVYATFGMTETVSHIALKKINGIPNNYFKTVPGIEIDIDDNSCLKVKGAVTKNEWLQTNDIVKLYTEGFEWIGRKDNVINTGGLKFQVEALEKLIEKAFHDLSIEVRFFISKLPHESLGEKIVLVIETDDIIDVRDVKLHLAKSCSKYQIPKTFYFLRKFKETPTGKIDKSGTLFLFC